MFIVVIHFVAVVMGVVVFVPVMVVVVDVVVVVGLLCVALVASRLIPLNSHLAYGSLSLKYSARIVYTLFLVSFSLFQAAILHHVVLFLLLQHNSWNFLCFYANCEGHAFRSDFHLTYRWNITDAGFSGFGKSYVARTQYKKFISGRGYVK